MTVVDVNTGKFTGSGGNLEETVTKNNLEAAEEIVRQLRLRDIGGIIVVDFIDMVLESNRDLVLRRLVECLGRDRTRHQVAEVTSLGLVQMTRKRIGTGLLEAFSETCEHCQGRGLIIHEHPVEQKRSDDDARPGRGGGRRSRGGRGRGAGSDGRLGRQRQRQRERRQGALAQGRRRDGPAAGRRDDDEAEDGTTTRPTSSTTRPDVDDVNDDLESLTSEVVESLDDRGDDRTRPRREPEPEPEPEPESPSRSPRARAGARARAGEAHRGHPDPPPQRQPPGRPAAVPAMDETPTAIGTEREGRSVRRRPTASSSRAPPRTRSGCADEDGRAPPHVEHVPIKRKGSRKR